MLEQPQVDELGELLCYVSTADAWVALLRNRPEVCRIVGDLASGARDEDAVRAYAEALFGTFSRGERFAGEAALAAIAVALESRPTRFAEEFLSSLARLRVAELPMLPLVAQICLKSRENHVAHNLSRSVQIATPLSPEVTTPIVVAPVRLNAENLVQVDQQAA